jgi:hypothetical protein
MYKEVIEAFLNSVKIIADTENLYDPMDTGNRIEITYLLW